MKINEVLAALIVLAVMLVAFEEAFGQTPAPALEPVLAAMEKRYDLPGFTAAFVQHSKMAAMEIEDKASGRIYIKRPGKMRWEYLSPDRQVMVSDGVQLWIYRPEDRQVMIGRAPDYFGDGKGASFLSDMRVLRHNFEVSLEADASPIHHRLKLVPKKRTADLASIFLDVRKDDFTIDTVTTVNAYDDETRIELSQFKADAGLAETLFDFDVPPGTEILKLE